MQQALWLVHVCSCVLWMDGWYMYVAVCYVWVVPVCFVTWCGYVFYVMCVRYLYAVFDEPALKQTHINNEVNAYPESG